MTWTYFGDPAHSPLDAVRFLIGDTDSAEQLLQNEEISFTLTSVNNSVYKAAVKCCDAILAKFAKDLDYTIGPEAVKVEQRRLAYKELRKQLSVGSSGPTPSSYSTHDAVFSIDMMTNK